MSFVVDNSVALTWCYEEERTPVTLSLLNRLTEDGAIAPLLWPIEAMNGLLMAERRGRISLAKRHELAGFLHRLPISLDLQTHQKAWAITAELAAQFRLTLYDATYLEVALRYELPLATLDKDLRAAAKAMKVELLGV